MDEEKNLSSTDERDVNDSDDSSSKDTPVDEQTANENGTDDGNNDSGVGNGYKGLASSNREAYARGLNENYGDRIAKNKAALDEARARAANPNKMKKGHEDEEEKTDEETGESNFKEKNILDKTKDKLNILGSKTELLSSKVDETRAKVFKVTHPGGAAKIALKAKIKAMLIPALIPICFGLMFVFVLFVVVLLILGLFNVSSNGSSVAGGSSCSYSIGGQKVSNIKVRLLNCEGNTPVSGEELIDFETYIMGVVYQELGGASYEALKAQAVAARSYALMRGKAMNGGFGVGLEKDDSGQWILSLRSCTNDQVFCNPDKGCWSNVTGGQTGSKSQWSNCTVHSGYDSSKNWSRKALDQDSDIRKAVEETKGQVLINNSGNIVYTSYVNTTQQKWNSLAKQGYDYFEILMDSYGSNGAAKISTPNCETIDSNIDNVGVQTLINMSQSEAWKQLIGKSSSERAPYVSQAEMDKRVTTITVPYRAWSKSGSNPRTDTVKKEKTITVNTALKDLWLAFFTDVYNEAPDFVIASFDGCYVYRKVTGGSSLSAHAYGVACDINAGTSGNGYNHTSLTKKQWEKLPNTRSKYQIVYQGSKVVEIAHKYTLINGSDWRKPNDSMHFSFIVDYNREQAQACQGKAIC